MDIDALRVGWGTSVVSIDHQKGVLGIGFEVSDDRDVGLGPRVVLRDSITILATIQYRLLKPRERPIGVVGTRTARRSGK